MRTLIFCFLTFILVGCGMPKYDPKKEYGFTYKEYMPPQGKARIFLYTYAFVGLNKYYVSIFQANDFNADNLDFSKATFLGKVGGSVYYVDIEPKPIILYGQTESGYTFGFEPHANKIYCIGGARQVGILVGRPYFSLITQDKCLDTLKDNFNEENKQDWERDRQKFIKKYIEE